MQLKHKTDFVAECLKQSSRVRQFAPFEVDRATIRLIQAGDQMQQRRFSAPGWSAKRDDFPGRHAERDTPKDLNSAALVPLPDVLSFYDGLRIGHGYSNRRAWAGWMRAP